MTQARTHAVVVTHNPELDALSRLLARTTTQVDGITVVDNHSTRCPALTEMVTQFANIELRRLDANRGLGAAQNIGIEAAREKRATHVLILDQDSVPAHDMIAALESVFEDLTGQGVSVAAVGARYLGSHAGNESFFVQFGWMKFKRVLCSDAGQRVVRADFLISSGTLFSLAALDAVGGMEESLFIDHIDTDWFLRATASGYLCYGACDAVMEHGLGESTHRVWFGRWRYVPAHKPFRYYYIFRNSVLLYRRAYAPWKWITNDIVRLLFIFVYYGILSEQRRSLVPMMARGLWHGVRGISGRTVIPS